MVHIDVDTSPISVETEYQHGDSRTLSRPVVYLGYERVWEGEYESWWSGPDEDEIKQEWDGYYQKFQAEQFREWLKTNGPGKED